MDGETTASEWRGGERRSLAAIVFTDVVGFSRHAAADEARTYAAMHRDFALFTQLCGERGGRVANTAGDSMLMIFGSAVDAMECALAIQGELHRQSASQPQEGILEHRIGVHIGDVILDGGNAFGDGVNVASRIQEICRPGAVAYSRAVSEIVTGKLDLRGVYLGPRRAKNIGEAIPVWEIPPILDHARLQAEMIAPVSTAPPSEGVTGGRAAALVALAGVLLAVGFAIVLSINTKREPVSRTPKPPLSRPAAATNTANTATANEPENSPTNVPANNTATDSTSSDPVAQAEETRRQIEELKARYDFDGIIALLERARDEPVAQALGPSTIGDALQRYRLLSSLKIWTDTEVRTIPSAKPLDLGDGTSVDSSTGTLMFLGNDQPSTPLVVWNLTPSRVLTLMAALDARQDRGSPPPAGGISEFAREYSLPDPAPTN